MAIDTSNEQMALMHFGQVWQPQVYIDSDGITQVDQQQLIWQYPGILWGAPPVVEQVMPIISDAGIHSAIGHGLIISGG